LGSLALRVGKPGVVLWRGSRSQRIVYGF